LQSISITPSHLLLSPSDNRSLINVLDFSKSGLSSVKDSTAFKKIQHYSKAPNHYLFMSDGFNSNKVDRLNSLYLNTSYLLNSKDYYTSRQNNYSTILSSNSNNYPSLDKLSVDKYLYYNFDTVVKKTPEASLAHNSLPPTNTSTDQSDLRHSLSNSDIISMPQDNTSMGLSLGKFDSENLDKLTINSTSDSRYFSNPVRPLTALPQPPKNAANLQINNYSDLLVLQPSDEISSSQNNSISFTRAKELKSPNLGFLSSDKNSRLISKLHSSKGQHNLSKNSNNLLDMVSTLTHDASSIAEPAVYGSSKSL
jgi:hypothetical protein